MKKYTYAAYDWNGRLVELSVIAETKAEAGKAARGILENAKTHINSDEGILLKNEENYDFNPKPPKGCEICNNPTKWAAVFGHEHKFGFPFLFARKQFFEDGKVKAAFCPLCGRKLDSATP